MEQRIKLHGIVGFLFLWVTVQAQMKIPPETVQQWASVFSTQLRDLSIKYSGSLLLQKKLKDVESIIQIVDLDGGDLVKDYADEIERMLGSKMKSVKRLAESAEDADLYHEFNASLEFDYYNSMLINTADEDGNFVDLGGEFPLEENEHFNKMAVNTQMSNIQVPTNVYNKDPNILNAIYNSEALNDVFIGNFQKDPTLTWQYFGSSTGFFRIYPGIKWTPDTNGVAAFDCRNRNWYIQAATSPKDIIIMVDISGSMKGLKMTIAKHTINTILDTLGENDFVNVIAYTDYVRYVEPCFKGTLVQADLDNREHFKMLVEELHVKGEAKIKNAMKESFKILSEARANGLGSMCNQAIMLITDGAMEDFESVFEEFNWPERRVRVFTYLIGREMTFAQNTKWIACNNKGYYTHVSTLADVQENVMEYLHVLSRPMVINHDHDIIWTEAYMDTVLPKTKELFNTKAQSLLLMTSVAMPVFSKKKETLSHGILLGVVGSDIPLMEVMKLAPRYMLGAHGYAFLITNNGYILAHPDLRPLYKDGKKLKPKPNYNSVDLSEVEWEDTEEMLRTAMVRGETGNLGLDIRASVDNGKRPLFLTNEYFYTNIDDTPFSFGMVLTRGHGKLMFVGNVSVEEGLHDLTSPDLSIAAEWTYCETDIDPAHRKYSQLQAAIRYLLGKEPDLECKAVNMSSKWCFFSPTPPLCCLGDEFLLQQTLFDAVVTAPMEAYWNALMLNARVEPGIETAFLGTRSGLMRIARYAGVETRVAKKFLTAADKDNLFTIDHFPLWYRLAVESPPGSFFYYPINDKGVKYVVATTAVTVSSQGKTAIAGAVGLQMSLDLLEKRFWAITKQDSNTDCSNIEGLCPLSCESPELSCFLVDNNGFTLLSKDRKEVGRFFGEVDGSVMATLIKMGMFRKVSLFDYQAMCKNSHHHASGARPLLSPLYVAVALLRWIFSNALMFLLDFNFCALWHSDYFVDAKAGYHTTHKQKKVEAMVPCETAYPAFMADSSVREANSIIKCGRCQKMFVVQQVPDSNLVFVVTEANCDCSRQYGPIPLQPKEIKYITTVKCNRMKSQKVRRRPESCHAYHPKENAKDCGGAAAISPSITLFSASLLVSVPLLLLT
uniref:voltage-dependent calcium channel subunit alpha-2/delta-4-like isoform X1 n=1 Tax=Doryrhamphus excisus TaxID=161450 RepID=UPI0025ADF964|nr:voltage-dependent calcium channel subunit alpha-2/delta-4-like isoform X1 [Doryrhamphus excisus]XP_057930555.1 voltage-dependent calcium channel subunit alpha-2/delta-4-like isoform X1 [Doryrhamphus excisus]XP_057930556.1 voltage-dependent calcium channel subunit alpha-2/delta-4-like isoform X1 [Doryrhamphus excisus]XP_057930557.1 voltage-dependent calcium channel subunit alpha-2/delta-4-like isoform X1 [Doryrhamphus excisus]XP_057930558.1 voltage-dependent calcium channel subunit alpha-2/de